MNKVIALIWVIVRAVYGSVADGRAHPDWTRSQDLLVRIMRVLLRDLVDRPVETHRSRLDLGVQPAPKGVRRQDVDSGNGLPGVLFEPPGADGTRLILHFHGGGYVLGAPGREGAFLGKIALESSMPVLAAGYRLAPEHSASDALQDALKAIDAVLQQGVEPRNLFLWGDSAGGGLALRALLARRDAGLSTLGGAVLGSPWVALRSEASSLTENEAYDYLGRAILKQWADWVGSETGELDQCLLDRDLSGLPRLRLLVGGLECFRDDIRKVHARAREAGVDVSLLEAPLGVHCWYMVPGMPGREDPLKGLASWLERSTAAATTL